MFHEMPFKRLIWRFSLVISLVSFPRNFAGKPLVSFTHETVMKLYPKLRKLENWTILLVIELTHEISHERTQKTCFSHKNNLKNFEKHGWYKSFPKAHKKNKNFFGLIHIRLSTRTSHLNMYKHTNEIGIHWTLNLCVVCEYQVWKSP